MGHRERAFDSIGVCFLFLEVKMSLRLDLIAAGRKAGGSHLTREAREGALNRFSKFLTDNNIQIKQIEHIKEKHIKVFLADPELKVKERVKQNYLSHLRVTLREAGRTTFADRMDTQAMGVQKASRDGTHHAISDDEYEQALSQAKEKDEGVAAALALCRVFGLRSKEAVVANLETLVRWDRELARQGRIEVIAGTKGGRPRSTHPAEILMARNAIKQAIQVAKNNKGYLIGNRDLKSALFRFHRVARDSGLTGKISPHSLRYRYAEDRMDARLVAGFSLREALAATSLDLGHGDGRGTYIKQVYSKR